MKLTNPIVSLNYTSLFAHKIWTRETVTVAIPNKTRTKTNTI